MGDIIVTSPKNRMDEAEQEALDCIANGGGYYVRILHSTPKDLRIGDRVWYTENGYLRGYAFVDSVDKWKKPGDSVRCETTGRDWPIPVGGCMVFMRADTWTWVVPEVFKGFQGWRYFDHREWGCIKIGGWRDPKPNPERYEANCGQKGLVKR